jgi:hypothetical protein
MHLEAAIEQVGRCIWMPRLSNSEMHLQAVIEQVRRCIWRPRLSNSRDTLGVWDQAGLEMHLEAEIK